MVVKSEYEGDVYLLGKRPQYGSDWMDEATLQVEAGNVELANLFVRMASAQCEVNRDWAMRQKEKAEKEKSGRGA